MRCLQALVLRKVSRDRILIAYEPKATALAVGVFSCCIIWSGFYCRFDLM